MRFFKVNLIFLYFINKIMIRGEDFMKPIFIVKNVINSNSTDEFELMKIFNTKLLKIILYLEKKTIEGV